MQRLSLVLSKEFLPIYFMPAVDAFLLTYRGRAEAIECFPDYQLRSINQTFKVPAIIRLPGLKYKQFYARTPSKIAIFYRDNFTCAYCGKQLRLSECTIDHIIPRSKGGKWSWTNLVTACKDCNSAKRDTIKQPIYAKPTKPTVFEIQLQQNINNLHSVIIGFLQLYGYLKIPVKSVDK